jgi:hypothetical protein
VHDDVLHATLALRAETVVRRHTCRTYTRITACHRTHSLDRSEPPLTPLPSDVPLAQAPPIRVAQAEPLASNSNDVRTTVHPGQARASVPVPPHGLVEAAGAVDGSERPMRVRRKYPLVCIPATPGWLQSRLLVTSFDVSDRRHYTCTPETRLPHSKRYDGCVGLFPSAMPRGTYDPCQLSIAHEARSIKVKVISSQVKRSTTTRPH